MPVLPDIDRLLADDAWLRRLARKLVLDPHLADDLAQDAWITAFDGAGEARAWRPWLAGVLRNLVRAARRSDDRREVRERSAARDEALPSAAEVVEEVTLRRQVTHELLELKEPLRSTLYLRFMRDLSPSKIAQRMGVSTSTVHERIQRGLEKLRLRLDHTHDGRRESWALTLLPLATPTGGSLATTTGGILMSLGFKVALPLAFVGGALGLWMQTRETPRPELALPGVPDSVEASSASAAHPPLETAEGEAVRAEVAAVPVVPIESDERNAAAAPAGVAADLRVITLNGRVVDTSLRPVSGLQVGFRSHGKGGGGVTATTTDPSGRFSLERAAPEAPRAEMIQALFARISGGEILVRDELLTQLAFGIVGSDELVVVVAPKVAVAGIVVDEAGMPISDARVAMRVRQSLYRAVGFTQFASFSEAGWRASTDAGGAFTIAAACGGEHVFLEAFSPGHATAEVTLPDEGRSDLVVVLGRLSETVNVVGRVVDDAGAPVAAARVSMGHTIELTDDAGEFTLRWNAEELARDESFGVRDASGALDGNASLRIAALKPGYAPARLELERADLESPLLLRFGPQPLSISGTVVDEDGDPIPAAVVWAKDLTPFGNHIQKLGEHSSRLATSVEEELRGGWRRRGTVSDRRGAFELAGLMPREYQIQVYDPATASLGDGWSIAPGAKGVRLVVQRDPSITRVAGWVVSASGEPISGVVMHVQRHSGGIADETHAAPPEQLVQDRTTNADGFFEFPALATAGTTLRLSGETIFLRSVELNTFPDLEDIEIIEPVLCELELHGGDSDADSFRVLDEYDQAVTVVVPYGSLGNVLTTDVKIEGGPTGVCRVPETGRTLVLVRQGQELTRHNLDLDQERRTVVHL